jgi:hypothetical protein
MISFSRLCVLARMNKKWIWIGLAALPAIRFYYVREMIAAFIMAAKGRVLLLAEPL